MLEFRPSVDGFLGIEDVDPEGAAVVVIPFGLEATVTFGGGTSAGPEAMIAASHEVELFDHLLECEPGVEHGVATLVPQDVPSTTSEARARLGGLVEAVLEAGRLPLVFGGEHAITPMAIAPVVARHPDLVLLHFDAHADLRDGYLGEPFSHASAIRRCLDFEGVRVCSFGIRNISREEWEYARANPDRVALGLASEKARWDLDALLSALEGKPVWITFDVDGLDASLMPATGTPEPGGLFWDDAMRVLDAASAKWGTVVGMDVNELAPIEGFHGPNFVAAKLAYRMLSLALAGSGTRVGSIP